MPSSMSEGLMSSINLGFVSPWRSGEAEGSLRETLGALLGFPQSLFIAQRFLMTDLVVPRWGTPISPLAGSEIPVSS